MSAAGHICLELRSSRTWVLPVLQAVLYMSISMGLGNRQQALARRSQSSFSFLILSYMNWRGRYRYESNERVTWAQIQQQKRLIQRQREQLSRVVHPLARTD